MRGINNFASNILCSVVMESFQAKKKKHIPTLKSLITKLCWPLVEQFGQFVTVDSVTW